MATPTITFNAGSGSDTQASGAGPATAVFGTSASYSGSVVTLDGSPDLSGVLTDGSHVLWLQTSTGRQFFTINAVDDGADTVTTDDAPAGTSSGLTWGIGGKRATLDNTDSRLLLSSDWKSDWIVELEDNQTLSGSAVSIASIDRGRIQSSTENTLRTITQGADAPCFQVTGGGAHVLDLYDLKFENTAGTKVNTDGYRVAVGCESVFYRCVFGDATNTLRRGLDVTGWPTITLIDCEITSCTSHGFGQGAAELLIIGCWIHDNTGAGVWNGNSQSVIIGSIIVDNGSDGVVIEADPSDLCVVYGCTFDGNTGDNIEFTSSGGFRRPVAMNCQVTNAGGYGVRGQPFGASEPYIDYCNFGSGSGAGGANTSGTSINGREGSNNVNVAAAYADAANDDWTPGAASDDLALPISTRTLGANQSSTTSYIAIGAVQRLVATFLAIVTSITVWLLMMFGSVF